MRFFLEQRYQDLLTACHGGGIPINCARVVACHVYFVAIEVVAFTPVNRSSVSRQPLMRLEPADRDFHRSYTTGDVANDPHCLRVDMHVHISV